MFFNNFTLWLYKAGTYDDPKNPGNELKFSDSATFSGTYKKYLLIHDFFYYCVGKIFKNDPNKIDPKNYAIDKPQLHNYSNYYINYYFIRYFIFLDNFNDFNNYLIKKNIKNS